MRQSGVRRPPGLTPQLPERATALRSRRPDMRCRLKTARSRFVHSFVAIAAAAMLAAILPGAGEARDFSPETADKVRIATFNTQLGRRGAGLLINDIRKRDPQVLAIAEIVLRTRPDILLLTKFDHDPDGIALDRFADLLAEGVAEQPGLDYPHRYAAEPNTGIPSGHDLDGDGRQMGERDALGYGRFPGQNGMALLSRFPFGPKRSFRRFPWADLPGASAPRNPDGSPFWSEEIWQSLPLSTTSHWDVVVTLPDQKNLHLLASHPTPPAFDGPEQRNRLRNAAEVSFWLQYLDGAALRDDAGISAPLSKSAPMVVLGDLNLDPSSGDGAHEVMQALLAHPRLQDPRPGSSGAVEAAKHSGKGREGDPALSTAQWKRQSLANLRVDYVLPSSMLEVAGAGVFWPGKDTPLARLIEDGVSSDHRLVWVDIRIAPVGDQAMPR